MDFLIPYATEVPRVELHHLETPSPLNPLGMKGVGEAGVIGAPAAVVSAIEDALRPYGVRISATPVTPAVTLPDRIAAFVSPPPL
jgi:CO/xanthine dehydrogenase Mo-binding subunit